MTLYGHTIPSQLDDFLNQMTYPVEAPEYAFRKHKAFESGELFPFYIPDKNAMVMTRLTIANMIDYSDRVIPFKIIHSDDIIDIYAYLSEYIRQLNQFSGIEEADQYLIKANHFKEKLRKSLIILAKSNDKAKKVLDDRTLTDLFKSLSGNKDQNDS